ncbi:MAG: NAD(P)-dependent alcohol dehydrogenase [Candidatus Obscuribacterales bacterium]|nr:NAD(P)-dependent alcohol dehydrogenase [Candidatus Obscuribacterales bacterium]
MSTETVNSSQKTVTITAKSFAAQSATAALAAHTINRRKATSDDVAIDILFCGVCHSDLHTARNEWKNTIYPVVPGHEIVGRVSEVGANVKKFKVGDMVGVGCMVDSCRTCTNCKKGEEQYCENWFTGTYNAEDKHLGGVTYGGYSESVVVNQDFVLRIPDSLDPAAAAPLLCAGITTYSPLHHWNVGPGQKVGIVGLGGLGHMGVKIANAMGAHVVVLTTSENKVADAKRLGAKEVIISKDAAQMQKHASSFDFILDTVSADHDINALLRLLKLDATLTLVGAPENPVAVAAFNLLLPRRNFAGSAIGGIKETQDMLDFCAKHKFAADIEMINIQQINEAYDRLLKQDVKYRFVIDMASLKK